MDAEREKMIKETLTNEESLMASLERVLDLLKEDNLEYLVVHYRSKNEGDHPTSHLRAEGTGSLMEVVFTLNVLTGKLGARIMGDET